jgi:PASTA domain
MVDSHIRTRLVAVFATAFFIFGCTATHKKISNFEVRQAAKTRRMPNLVGLQLSDEEHPGWLRTMQRTFGFQTTVAEASDSVPEGEVIRQVPAAGTRIDDGAGWTLVLSDGGPVVRLEELPAKDRDLAISLGVRSPIKRFDTAAGPAYKTDQWLFAWNCDAIDAAYRISLDARYDTKCVSKMKP